MQEDKLDPFAQILMLKLNSFTATRFQHGEINTDDLFDILWDQMTKQGYDTVQTDIPEVPERLLSGLTIDLLPQFHPDARREDLKNNVVSSSPFLRSNEDKNIHYIGRPNMPTLTTSGGDDRSMTIGCIKNETSSTSSDSDMQEHSVPFSTIRTSEDDPRLDQSNNTVDEMEVQENSQPNITQLDIERAFGNTGSPLSVISDADIGEDDRLFRCPHCPHRTNRPYNLRSHIRTHFNNLEKRFKCPCCSRGFERKSDLRRHHSSIHLGEKNHLCFVCGKAFTRKYGLRIHMKAKHSSGDF